MKFPALNVGDCIYVLQGSDSITKSYSFLGRVLGKTRREHNNTDNNLWNLEIEWSPPHWNGVKTRYATIVNTDDDYPSITDIQIIDSFIFNVMEELL